MNHLRKYNESVVSIKDVEKLIYDFESNFLDIRDEGYEYIIYLLDDKDLFIGDTYKYEELKDKIEEIDLDRLCGFYFFINTNCVFKNLKNRNLKDFRLILDEYNDVVSEIENYMERLSSVFGLDIGNINIRPNNNNQLSIGIKVKLK